MPENQPPKNSAVLGFLICIMLLVAMGSIAVTAVSQLLRHSDHSAYEAEAAGHVTEAARFFDAMQVAVLRYQETGAEEFVKQAEEHSLNAAKALDEAAKLFHDGRNRELVDRLRAEIENGNRFNQETAMLGREREKILAEQTALISQLDALLQEAALALDKTAKDGGREIEGKRFLPVEAVAKCKDFQTVLDRFGQLQRDRQRILTAMSPNIREECLKQASVRFAEIKNGLQQVKPTDQKTVAMFREIEKPFDEFEMSFRKIFDLVQVTEKMRMESDMMADRISQAFHETIVGTEKVREMLADEAAVLAFRFVTMIVIVGIVGVVLCLFAGLFVARKPSPKSAAFDPYSTTGETSNRDLSVVADKLQEVVDLLRR